jgi:methylated-DNA-[protein]-cysteine S-methyltransferase
MRYYTYFETPLGRVLAQGLSREEPPSAVPQAAPSALTNLDFIDPDTPEQGREAKVDRPGPEVRKRRQAALLADLSGLYTPEHPLFLALGDYLSAYFAGERPQADFALELRGSPFQLRVWHLLAAIPYGETRSYGFIAGALAADSSSSAEVRGGARAVGGAVGRNPISIIIPCHRVVGQTGALTGYGGGLHRKEYLLKLEAHQWVS